MIFWTSVEGLLSDGLPMRLWIAEREGKIWRSSLHDDQYPCTEDEFLWRCEQSRDRQRADRETLAHAAREVQEYFAGKRLTFGVPMEFHGTPFQVRVWRELTRIPFGSTKSYGEVAEAIGSPRAPRAVGGANGCNHLPIFVPCHRVIASGGKLGGFTGGIGLKQRLLAHEAAVLGRRAAA
ncbi:MAG TPA: methylated-DNA--[protein]-cysteine S-methyltransferase [Bryobacteraceae bacterium]